MAKNTTSLKKRSNNRLYGVGTKERGLSFSIFGFRNGIPVFEASIALILLAIWSFFFNLTGLQNNSFGGIGAVIHYGPPVATVWYFTRSDKDTETTPLDVLVNKTRKKFMEPDYYIANEESEVPHLITLTTSIYTPNPYTQKSKGK